MEVTKERFLLFFLSCELFLFFLILLSCVIVIKKYGLLSSFEENSDLSNYNTFKNDHSVGIATIPQNENQDFETNNEGKYNMISQFGDGDDYECTGSCFCRGSTERENSATNIFSKGMFYIVSSVSSVLAFQKAREYFDDKCVSSLSSTCNEDSIISEVTQCQKTILNKNKETKNEKEEKEEKPRRDIRKYMCKGHCVSNTQLKRPEALDLAKRFRCENIKRMGEIEVDVTEKGDARNTFARQRFSSQYLTKFCRERSEDEYFYRYFIDGKLRYKRKIKFNKCTSTSIHPVLRKMSKSNVHCVQTYPEYTNANPIGSTRHW